MNHIIIYLLWYDFNLNNNVPRKSRIDVLKSSSNLFIIPNYKFIYLFIYFFVIYLFIIFRLLLRFKIKNCVTVGLGPLHIILTQILSASSFLLCRTIDSRSSPSSNQSGKKEQETQTHKR